MIQKKQEKILKVYEEEEKVFLMFTRCTPECLKFFVDSFQSGDSPNSIAHPVECDEAWFPYNFLVPPATPRRH